MSMKSKLAPMLALACVFAASNALAQDAAAPAAKDVLPSKAGGLIIPKPGILPRPGLPLIPKPGLPILPGKPLVTPVWPGSLPKPGVSNPTGVKPGTWPRVLPIRPLLDPPGLRPILGIRPMNDAPAQPTTPTAAGAYDR